MKRSLQISSYFEQGKIGILRADQADAIELELLEDNASGFISWFYFRVSGAKEQDLRMRFVNARAAEARKTDGMPDIWPGYQAFASYDLQHWFLVPTVVDDTGMTLDEIESRARDRFTRMVAVATRADGEPGR